MNTTAITFIHEDLKYESILIQHNESFDDFMIRLNVRQNELETITLVDVVMFLYQNNYDIIDKSLFFDKSEYEESDLFDVAENKTEFAFDMEFSLI